MKKLNEKHGDVKNLSGGNYNFLILEEFIIDMDELNYEALDEEWVDMFEFFYKSDQSKKLFKKYKFCPLSPVKIKLKIHCKLVFYIVYIATKFFMDIQTCNDIENDNIKSLI